MKKIVIFGASLYGKIAYKILSEKYEIVAFSDNNENKWGDRFCDIAIIPPEQIKQYQDVTVVIASQYYYAIGKQLKQNCIHRVKIFVYKGLLRDLEHYDGEYLLFESDFQGVYNNIVIDKNKMQEIRKNFSSNYNNSGDKFKKVLFVAGFFPPSGEGGVQRSLKFVKYLRDFGYEPIVVTVDEVSYVTKDESLLSEIPEGIRIIRIKNDFCAVDLLSSEVQQEIINLYYGVTQSEEWVREYIQMVTERYEDMRNILIPDNFIYWANQVLKQIEQKINLNEIDLIFTTAYPYSDYFIGYYLKNKYGIPWVMEDRDSWTANEYIANIQMFKNKKASYKLETQLHKKLATNADRVVVTGEQTKEDYICKFGLDREAVYCITNGYDEADFVNIAPKGDCGKFTICYNGWIHGDCNPVHVINVINELIDDEKIKSEKIEWIFNGNMKREVKELLMQSDRYHILKFNGYLSHLESLSVAAASDVLVLFGGIGERSKLIYTGKIFEYLRLKRPILGFSTEGGLFDNVFAKTGSGKNFGYENIKGVKEYLLQLYQEWEEGGTIIQPIEEEIRCFERRKLTEKLKNVFQSAINQSDV